MVTLQVPNPGHTLIALLKAKANAENRYAKMQSCKTCDKEVAEQWKRDGAILHGLILQLQRAGNE